jgi:streptogramin lyase
MGSSFISPVDGNIWFSSRTSSSMLRLDPKEQSADRWKNYPIKGDIYVHPDGIGVDKRGHVFWAELKTGRLGELDPATGKQIRYSLPEQAGALHEAVVDKDGTVGFDLIYGALFGRLNPLTGVIHMYPTPTPDNGLYGMVIDQKGNMWAAGWQKGTINKWDVDTEAVKEYPVPHSWGHGASSGPPSTPPDYWRASTPPPANSANTGFPTTARSPTMHGPIRTTTSGWVTRLTT